MLKFEMEQNYYNEMDKLKNENEMEMRAIRAEMDRTLEIGRQKEREFEIKTDEFQTEFKLKQKHMDRLTNEINELCPCRIRSETPLAFACTKHM